MIIIKNTFNNGFFDCYEIYSDNGKKILETTNGEKWNTDYEHPIVIAAKRRADYVEIEEPVVIGMLELAKPTNDYYETNEPVDFRTYEKQSL